MIASRAPRQIRSQWPPAPCVEEESQSLSKEHGHLKPGEKPGVEGVHTRGVVDQYPIIESANSPTPSSTFPASNPSVPGLAHVSSDESTGPPTPPLQKSVKVRFEDEEPRKNLQRSASQPRPSRSQQKPQQPSRREPSGTRETRPYSYSPPGNTVPKERASQPPPGPSTSSRTGSRATDMPKQPPPSALRSRSGSFQQAPSATRPLEHPQRNSRSGYSSDSPTVPDNRPPVYQTQAPVRTHVPSASAPRARSERPRRQSRSGYPSDPIVSGSTSAYQTQVPFDVYSTPRPMPEHLQQWVPSSGYVSDSATGPGSLSAYQTQAPFDVYSAPRLMPEQFQQWGPSPGHMPDTTSVSSSTSAYQSRPPVRADVYPASRPMQERVHKRGSSSGYMSDSATNPVSTSGYQSRAPVRADVYSASRPMSEHLQPPEPSPGYMSDSATNPGSKSGYQSRAPVLTEAYSAPRPMPEHLQPPEPSPGHLSDSATLSNKPALHQREGHVKAPKPTAPANAVSEQPSVADRLEEKLRQRKEERGLGSTSDRGARGSATAPSSPTLSPSLSAATDSRPQVRSGSDLQTSRNRSSSVTVPPARSMSGSRPPLHRQGPEMVEKSKPTQSLVAIRPSPDSSHVQSSSRSSSTSPPHSSATGNGLAPCLRPTAVAGYQDWYTLKGLEHLDICPSCKSQVENSRYSDLFIPGKPKPTDKKVSCAFANAWVRLAWAQMIKNEEESLESLYQMTRPPPGTRPCPEDAVAEQRWYRIYDSKADDDLPGFHICSSCARNVRILLPAHRDTFSEDIKPTEQTCDFVTSSPWFVKFIDLLDASAADAEADRAHQPNQRDFLAYARRKVALRDRNRNRPELWHFISELPEFCVCEECYDEVVWPLVELGHPIARDLSETNMRLSGGRSENRRKPSCQLYSPRMRAVFQEAVENDDLEMLKTVAKKRLDAERRYVDRREELRVAIAKGYNCDEEMKKAVDEWRKWE